MVFIRTQRGVLGSKKGSSARSKVGSKKGSNAVVGASGRRLELWLNVGGSNEGSNVGANMIGPNDGPNVGANVGSSDGSNLGANGGSNHSFLNVGANVCTRMTDQT